MAEIVPLQATPAQSTSVTLANQSCSIKVYQQSTGLYVDLYVNDELIVGGVVALNRNRIVRDSYLGFAGDLIFVDNQGDADPDYRGLGDRFEMAYLSAEEVAGLPG